MPTDHPKRRFVTIALSLALLLVIGGGTAAYAAMSKTIALIVDGRTETVRTFAGTAAEVLAAEGVSVSGEDALNVEPSASLSDGQEIEVSYARDFELTVDGATTAHTTHAATVDEALAELDVDPAAGAWMSAPADATLPREDAALVVSNPKKLTVAHDRTTTTVRTTAPTVAEVLEEADVSLGQVDEVAPALSAYVQRGQKIDITRIAYQHKLERNEKKVEVTYRDDDELERGSREVVQEGRPAVTQQRLLLTKANGEVRSRLVLTSEQVQKPQQRIIVRGTKEPEPEPEPEAAPESASPSGGSSSSGGGSTAPAVPGDSVWDRLAQCESGGNWSINTGNGYYGGVQFSAETWKSLGGPGLPHENSREVQIQFAKKLQAQAGWGQWPSCAAKLGLL